MKLLTIENAKTVKGESLGILTGILYLAPAWESGVMNTCEFSSEQCREFCLFKSGRAEIFPHIIEARIRKTVWLASDRAGFIAQLRRDIVSLVRRAKRQKLTPAVRINGTSDLAWLAMMLASEFPNVQFYDYTKLPKAWQRTRPNYHLTFSLSENNHSDAMAALAHGLNVAVVFDVKRGKPLPEKWEGFDVADGDTHDLRFLDSRVPHIIGLRAKGPAKKASAGGFVQISALATV